MKGGAVPARKMPTGEEPPRGYESLVEKPKTREVRVKGVFVSQLARSERSEIEALRARALSSINALAGLTNDILSFENEINLISNKNVSDKMLFLARQGSSLAGYALIIIGWPDPGTWTIQHMIINPDNRLQGVGTTLVETVESYALSSDVASENIFAIPIEREGTGFWKFVGYTEETGRLPIRFAGLDHELVICRKAL
jgi:GNAT superfamily N-acetyltransferase